MRIEKKQGYYGMDYVTVSYPVRPHTDFGYTVHAKVLLEVDKKVCLALLQSKVPLRGIEVKFLRKSLGFTMQALGDLLGMSATAIMKWEKKSNERLDKVNEIALRAILAQHLHLKMAIEDAILDSDSSPPRLKIAVKTAA